MKHNQTVNDESYNKVKKLMTTNCKLCVNKNLYFTLFFVYHHLTHAQVR